MRAGKHGIITKTIDIGYIFRRLEKFGGSYSPPIIIIMHMIMVVIIRAIREKRKM
jgi:hypothetical protein